MAKIKLAHGRVIGEGSPPYVIAEFNTSHNGSVATARAMIDSARDIGCDCVKFQSWSADTLYARTYYEQNPIAKRIVNKFAFDRETLGRLAAYCAETGIDFASTPYSRAEVDALVEFGAPFIKIASMELNNIPFLEYIGKTKLPVILSTGMGEAGEIAEAVRAIESTGNHDLCLLHCVSIYPAAFDSVHLRNMVWLREAFPQCPAGFSDHTLGAEIAIAAAALGAAVIEKHFTLDKSKIGMDNQMALEPPEMKALVDGCRNVFLALGEKNRVLSGAEREQRTKMRRSIVAARDMPAGTILAPGDLDVKRPGTGLAPTRLEELIGSALKTDVRADEIIAAENIMGKGTGQ
ncbi:MAG: N-acetylneuraminate synthase family protein [Gracilibacteraceae bacterium]|jgi:N-acetylneuraminate synthase|nr:N-acetylneuraminate synthase family protein [Gracilibacteraceae bacterium]